MKKGLKVAVIVLAVLTLGLGGLSYFMYSQYTKTVDENAEYYNKLASYERSVYVATAEIKAGDILKEGENVEKQNVATALASDFFVDASELNKVALTDISVGTPIYKIMVADKEIDNLTRSIEISTVSVPLTLTNGAYVDIRIMFPNGEDYIVLSKKRVSNLFLEDVTFTTELSEEEINRLSSAIIDTFTVSGTKMYCTTYVAPSVQEASVPNYLVRNETIDVLAKNPNLADVELLKSTINSQLRSEMEARLANLSEEQLTAVQKGHDIEDTASASALVGITNGNYEVDVDANNYDGTVEDEDYSVEAVEADETEANVGETN